MPAFSAKDVQKLRQLTGVGMLDAKRALEENDGDMDKADQWLREQGLASQAKRADREASEGRWPSGARATPPPSCSCGRRPTSWPSRTSSWPWSTALADLVAAQGEDAIDRAQPTSIDNLKITLKENISVGQVVRIEAPAGGVVDSYLHLQAGRGVNAVVVALRRRHRGAGPRHRRPHRLRPARPTSPATRSPRTRWPPSARRWRRSPATRASPKPPCPRSSRAGSNGWYKERVLLDQPYVKDEKQTIAKLLGSATVTRFAQVVVGD